MKNKCLMLLFLLAISNICLAQVKDRAVEIGLFRLSNERSDHGQLPLGDPTLSIYYTQKLHSKFYLSAGLGYESQSVLSKCPGSFCYDFMWENYYGYAGLRYYISKPTNKYQLFAETGIQVGKYFKYQNFSGGIIGSTSKSDQSGLQLVGVARLGIERNIIGDLFFGTNAHLEIGTLYATSSSGYSSGQEQLPELGGSLYGNITYLEIRIGYRF